MPQLAREQQLLFDQGKLLPLMEDFYTLQGEGFNTGKAAYFIRLGGCDVGCHWCDVKESWNAELHPLTSIEAIAEKVVQTPAKSVVVTGGEPLLYDLGPLCSALKNQQVLTFIETSGAYPLSGHWDWICLSPKKFKAPRKDMLAVANELKVIVFNSSDFDWAEKHAKDVNSNCHLFLQPEWSREKRILPEIIAYIQQHPHWRISLQTHKYMHIP